MTSGQDPIVESETANEGPGPISARTFAPDDQAVARAVIQDGLRSRWGNSFDPAANPDTDDLWRSYVAPGGEMIVAESGGQVIGTGVLTNERLPNGQASGVWRMRRISVVGTHQRRGVGRLIVAELARRAAAHGATEVVVSTDTPWTDAIALYKRCGFTQTSRDDEETHLHLILRRPD